METRSIEPRRIEHVIARLLCALLSIGFIASAFGQTAVTKGSGDVGLFFFEKAITKPIIWGTLLVLNPDDQSIPVAFNRPALGQAASFAQARNGFSTDTDQDPAAGQGDPNKPSFRVGTIFTPGDPPTVGAVATRTVSASVTEASASAQGQISGSLVPGQQPGSLLGVNGITLTTANASAVFGAASSSASAGTDPFVLSPLPEGTRAQFDIELNSALDLLVAFATEGASGEASFRTQFTSNLSAFPVLFDLGIEVEHDSSKFSVVVNLTSSLPFSEAQLQAITDSIVIDEASGSVSLLPSGPFSFVFDLPENMEIEFDSFSAASASASAPDDPSTVAEPSTVALILLSLGSLLALRTQIPSRGCHAIS